MQLQHGTSLHHTVLVRCFVFAIRFAQERQGTAVSACRWLNHMRHKLLAGHFVAIGEIATAATMPRLAVLVFLHFHRIGRRIELAFHVTA